MSKVELTAIEKLRIITNWTDYHDEGFNLKIRTLVDWEKLYDFSVKHDIGCVDLEGINNSTDTIEECDKLCKQIEKMLGYKVY